MCPRKSDKDGIRQRCQKKGKTSRYGRRTRGERGEGRERERKRRERVGEEVPEEDIGGNEKKGNGS